MNGIVIVNKEKDYTSRDVVNVVSKTLKTKQVGHTGTLDPLATGVLVICVGSATKLVEVITSYEKEYVAEVVLGLKTDTLDITGNILEDVECIKTEVEITEVLNSFNGIYNQEVPIYSAVKINGKKLYEYARNNEEVVLPKREVEIKNIRLIDNVIYKDGKTIFKFKCIVSKGTYIRSLITDIASKLNCNGVMSNLERTKQGVFNIEDSFKLEDIKIGSYKFISLLDCLDMYKKVEVDDEIEAVLLNGNVIDNVYGEEYIVFYNKNKDVIAIYQTFDKEPNKLKPWKMFKIK